MTDPYKSLTDLVKPEDKKYILNTPDKDFSPARNKAIVEQTIREYEINRAKKLTSRVEEYEERADAVVTYLKSLTHGGANSNMEKYFGKKNLAYLRGQEIKERLMANMIVKDQAGNIIRKGF